MRCINSRRYDPVAYVHLSLTKEAYLQTYTSMIHPIPDEALWPEVDFDHGSNHQKKAWEAKGVET